MRQCSSQILLFPLHSTTMTNLKAAKQYLDTVVFVNMDTSNRSPKKVVSLNSLESGTFLSPSKYTVPCFLLRN